MAKFKTSATATFEDCYFGKVPVQLRKAGSRYVWESSEQKCVTTGYRPLASVERAVRVAQADRRFSDVRVAP